MITALFIMGGLGVVVGVGLAVASKVFYVWVDPKIEAVDDALPGANCGGCGLPGCLSNAEAIVAGKAAPNSCVAAGPEVAEAIAAIMGVAIEAKEPDIARPGCTYGVQDADTKFIYDGVNDCRAAVLLGGGVKVCTIGCIGLGSCVRACQFDALSMGPDGLPVVSQERCTGCGACERTCPKHIINLSSVTRRIIREYTTEDCTTPCQRACPAGIDICEYIRQIGLGNYTRAVQVIKERNPFPGVIGRICPRPCENECRRQYVDEPVAINFLKRYAADCERQSGERVQPYKAPDTGRKIAVIGGGVQGLSAAFFSARLGHDATVFEATSQLGGLLRKAIAPNRLPHDVLDWDIEGILEMGVKVQTDTVIGKDVTVAGLLQEGFEAVFVASGGWDSRLSRGTAAASERPIPGTYLLIELAKTAGKDQESVLCGEHVLIFEGGKLGLQAVEACKRLGAKTVTLMFRESPDQLAVASEEFEEMTSQGINLIFKGAISRVIGEGSRLTEVEYVDMNSGEKKRLTVQTLLLASGRFPELVFSQHKLENVDDAPAQNRSLCWETTSPYKQPTFITETGLMAKGDALSDFSGAIRAIGAGRRAAASIHQIIYGIDLTLPENVVRPGCHVQNVDHVENVASRVRQIMPIGSTAEPGVRELEKGFNEDQARVEADRCLRCGLVCYEKDLKEVPKMPKVS